MSKLRKKPKADKRANPQYDEPQSIYREGVNAEEALQEMLRGADGTSGRSTSAEHRSPDRGSKG